MQLDDIMREMKMDAKFIGIQEFDTLGLIHAKLDKRICTFVSQQKYINGLSNDIILVVTNDALKGEFGDRSLCIVKNPRLTFFKLHNFLVDRQEYIRPSFDTTIGENCHIHNLSSIAQRNVTIGENVTIEEFVSIKENVTIGDNSIIRAGAILGGEGFEQKKEETGAISVKHSGGVIVGQNVEIQQNTCINKAVFPWDNTIIGNDCRISNLVHIAHAVKMKERVFVTANASIAGRVSIGRDVWIGPGVTISNEISIGDYARVNIGSVVTQDVKENGKVTGNFAVEHSKFIEQLRKNR